MARRIIKKRKRLRRFKASAGAGWGEAGPHWADGYRGSLARNPLADLRNVQVALNRINTRINTSLRKYKRGR